MSTIKLTKSNIERISAPTKSGKPELTWDVELTGFGVWASGVKTAKTYVVQGVVNKKTRRVTIGPTNVVEFDKARIKAASLIADMIAGIDPKATRRAERDAEAAAEQAAAPASSTATTLQSALDHYLRDNKELKATTKAFYKSCIHNHLADWLRRPLVEITLDMVRERHSEIAERIAAQAKDRKARAGRFAHKGDCRANGVMRSLRAIWNNELERDQPLPPNPVRLKRRHWFKEPARERVLKADQYPAFYRAILKVGSTTARDFILLLMFSGMRRGEAAALRWDCVDFVNQVIRVPKGQTKTSKALDLPMSDFLRELLVARRAIGVEDPFLFPSSTSSSGHIEDPKPALREIEAATGIWIGCHDLRRGFITAAETLKLPPMAAMALVNHGLGNSVHANYARFVVEDLREPMQMITDKLKALCQIETPAGVRELVGAGRRAAAE